MALNLARIIGTITGKLAFERTDANFQLVQTDVNSHGTLINALVPKANIANNLVTTAEGLVLDAQQGKALNDKINTLIIPIATTYSYNLATGAHVSVDMTLAISAGYNILCAMPVDTDPAGHTAQLQITIFRRNYVTITVNIVNKFTETLSGTLNIMVYCIHD